MAVNQYDRSYDNMFILYNNEEGRYIIFSQGFDKASDASWNKGFFVWFASDWDILILLDKEKITSADFDTYAYPLIDLGWQFGEYFSTKLYTFTEWMKRKGTPFFKNVELDGIEL